MAFDASDLTPHEHLVVDRTRAGDVADFTSMAGPGGVMPAVRAGFLRKLLLQTDQNWEIAAPGVQIKAARIEGALDLSGCTNVPPLALIACVLNEAMDISHARIARLSLQASTLPRLNADHVEIGGALNITTLRPAGAEGLESLIVQARGARVGGDFVATGAKLARRLDAGDDALCLDNAHISGEMLLDNGFEAFGRVSLVNAHIDGALSLDAGHLLNRAEAGDAHAFNAEGARLSGLWLTGKLKAEGEVRLASARIDGDVDLTGATLRNEGATSLNLTNAHIGGQVLADGARLGGQVLLVGARIAKNLDLRGLEVLPRTVQRNETHGRAIDATNISVGGAALFHGANLKGELLLADARIEGYLAFGGGRFINGGQWAIRAPNARVGGNLTFKIADNGFAPLGQKTVIEGGAKFDRAQIDGSVAWAALELRGPGPENAKGGMLSFSDARITGTIQARALTAQDGARVDLSGASCAALDDDIKTGWGPDGVRVDLEGLTYSRLDGRDERAAPRLSWLKRARIHGGRYAPQPYAEVARVYARAGRREDARRVSLAQHDLQTHYVASGPITWAMSAAFGLVAGYGFAPLRVIRALVLFLALGVAGVLTMNAQGALVRPDGSACSGAIEPALYAMDVALPVIDLGQERLCAPGRTARADLPAGVELDGTDWRLFEGAALWKWAHALYTILGAILSALAVLTFSGMMKPRLD
jgi:uncharacterized protein YjbI with pentapeptide repeats